MAMAPAIVQKKQLQNLRLPPPPRNPGRSNRLIRRNPANLGARNAPAASDAKGVPLDVNHLRGTRLKENRHKANLLRENPLKEGRPKKANLQNPKQYLWYGYVKATRIDYMPIPF